MRVLMVAPVVALLSACAYFGHHRESSRGDSPATDSLATAAASPDAIGLYRDAGLIVSDAHFPFVGVVHYFAARTADSTLALVALSFANQALTFAVDGATRHARYDVVLEARQGKRVLARTANRETVRVSSSGEAMDGDARIIFQRYLTLPPGDATLIVDVRDANGANGTTVRTRLMVPRLGARTLAPPVVAYAVTPRIRLDSLPRLVVNPRDAMHAEHDCVATVYVEGYGVASGTRVTATVLDGDDRVMQQDTALFGGDSIVSSATFHLPLARLGAGRFTVSAVVPGLADTVRTPLLVQMAREARVP